MKSPLPDDSPWRQEVIDALHPQITPARAARIEEVLRHRTYGITAVLESIYDQGNTSAVLRSADSLGIQRVNLILTSPRTKLERKISLGSEKWLDVHRYYDPVACVRALQADGYQVLATHLEAAQPIGEVDFSRRTALVFGNEKRGVSPELLAAADGAVYIPMVGFAQSFNISVAAALALYHATQDRQRRLGVQGDLDEAALQALRERFYRRSVRHSDLLLESRGLTS
jgi:tRNA (guanosine-2'-O-)-methyltransferase